MEGTKNRFNLIILENLAGKLTCRRDGYRNHPQASSHLQPDGVMSAHRSSVVVERRVYVPDNMRFSFPVPYIHFYLSSEVSLILTTYITYL